MKATRQVISVVNGVASTLRGGLLDLRSLNHGNISCRRSSDIQFDHDAQKHYVEFLDEDLIQYNPIMRTLMFDTYEEAVEKEVQVINNHRLNKPFMLSL